MEAVKQWRLALAGDRRSVEAFELALEPFAPASLAFEVDEARNLWTLEGIGEDRARRRGHRRRAGRGRRAPGPAGARLHPGAAGTARLAAREPGWRPAAADRAVLRSRLAPRSAEPLRPGRDLGGRRHRVRLRRAPDDDGLSAGDPRAEAPRPPPGAGARHGLRLRHPLDRSGEGVAGAGGCGGHRPGIGARHPLPNAVRNRVSHALRAEAGTATASAWCARTRPTT